VVWQGSGTLCLVESIDADCVGDSVCVDVVFTGVEESVATDFLIYPNPSGGLIHIESNGLAPVPFIVLDALGKSVFSGSLAAGRNDLNVEFLSAGIYLIQTHSANHPLIIVK
jgi:hypothetical protein